MNRLGQDPVPKLPLHCITHDQIDSCSQELFEPVLDSEEVKQTNGSIELDQEIDVAVRLRLATRD